MNFDEKMAKNIIFMLQHASTDTKFISLEELENMEECIKEIKNIIDEVIGY